MNLKCLVQHKRTETKREEKDSAHAEDETDRRLDPRRPDADDFARNDRASGVAEAAYRRLIGKRADQRR